MPNEPNFHSVSREELARRIAAAIEVLGRDPHWCEVHEDAVRLLEHGEEENDAGND